jgi:hypothetical protein
MPKYHQFSLLLGVALAGAAIIGCGSPTTADKKPVAPVSSSVQPLSPTGDTEKPEGETEEIDFQFRFAEPLVGRVVASRTLERQSLDSLECGIEWSIRIEPTDEGLRISSGDPKVSPLRARLPEDALNQLLIGRMFLPSGVLDNDGTFRAAEGTTESVKALHDALSTASTSLLPGEDVGQFLNNALSETTLETTCREHWKTMVQSFIGKTMQLGETYETEAPGDMPLGGSVVFVSKLKAVSQEPCVPGQSEQRCVRIVAHSQPKGSLIDAIQESVANYIPVGASFERFDMTIDMVQIVDPLTLVPHSLTIVRTTKADMRLPNRALAPIREVSTETWQYVWENHEAADSK